MAYKYITYNSPSAKTEADARKMVRLDYKDGSDLNSMLRKIAMDYCMEKDKPHLWRNGLSIGELLDMLDEKHLEPYGIKISFPDELAVRLNSNRTIVDVLMLQLIEDRFSAERKKRRRFPETACRYARRFIKEKENKHPIISTWDDQFLIVEAINWAWSFVDSGERDSRAFYDKMMKTARPEYHPDSVAD